MSELMYVLPKFQKTNQINQIQRNQIFKNKMPGKEKQQKQKKPTVRIAQWYKADDEPAHFRRRQKRARAGTLRKSITPGTVLILLGGRFKGKRVVFLKQLKSGLLLVTGPHKVNGVPLKRVNQAYVIPTQTKVDLAGVSFDQINDEYFAKTVVPRHKNNEKGFYQKKGELTEEQKKTEGDRLKKKRETQATVDKALVANVKKVEFLKSYLNSRFSLTNTLKPHELVF